MGDTVMANLRCGQKNLPPTAVLRQTGWTLDLAIEGHSMAPLLCAGDNVTIACLPPESLRPGDLICFQVGGGFVLHRLLEYRASDRRCFFEKGDAESGGRWLDESCVLGRAVRINGQAIDDAVAARMLAVSRWESTFAGCLRRLGLPRLPSVVHRLWRGLKMRLFAGYREK